GELRTGLGLPTVAAEDERRTGGGGDAGGQRFEFGGGGLRFGQLGEGGGGRLGEADEDVLGQTDDDGTGPAGRGDAQRFGGELAGAVLVVDGDHAFRGRGEPLGQAELLEGFARPVRGRDETDEEDERRRVLPGG